MPILEQRPDRARARDCGAASMRMRVPAHPTSIPDVREAVDRILDGWPGERPHDVVLAVVEAVGNAIEHGSPPGAPVEITLTVTAGEVRVRVADVGRPGAEGPRGDPTAPPPHSPRGRGRLIMRELADRVEERTSGSGTAVLLDFRRP